MRYRPFGASGKAVSAVSLLLRDAPNMSSPGAWRGLVISAMESGVNSFEATAGSDVLALGLGDVFRLHLLAQFLAVDLGLDRAAHGRQVEQHVRRDIVQRRSALAGRVEQAHFEQLVPRRLGGRQRHLVFHARKHDFVSLAPSVRPRSGFRSRRS